MATYLGTIRPTGALGDHSDATSDSASDGGVGGALSFSWVALGDLAEGTISFLRFFARVSREFAEQGPLDPTVGPKWRLGAAGTEASYTETLASTLPVTIESGDKTTDPDGAAWTLASVATLQMTLAATTDDNGSHAETTVTRYELYAEVWGSIAGDVYNAIAVTGEAGAVAVTGEGGGSVAASGMA
jgi:hypothetical protein